MEPAEGPGPEEVSPVDVRTVGSWVCGFSADLDGGCDRRDDAALPLATGAPQPSERVGEPEQRLVVAVDVFVAERRLSTARGGDHWVILGILMMPALQDERYGLASSLEVADDCREAEASHVGFVAAEVGAAHEDRDIDSQLHER